MRVIVTQASTGDGGEASRPRLRSEGRKGCSSVPLSGHLGASVSGGCSNLADYVEVKGGSFEGGLLKIELVREVPEAIYGLAPIPDHLENVGRSLAADGADFAQTVA